MRGFFFPLLLICLGGAFLLSNVGVIGPLTLGALLQLWPLVLILLGIDLLLARRSPLAALALELGVIVLGVAYVAAAPGVLGALGAPVLQELAIGREGERELALRFAGGAGQYRISGGADALLEASANGPGLRHTISRSGDRTVIELEQTQNVSFVPPFRPSTSVEVRVANDVRLSLDVSAGAGTFRIDLRDVATKDVTLSFGAGTVHLVLPRPNGDIPVHVSKGAGTVTVEVPAGVEARVSAGGGFVNVRSSNPRLVVQGGVAETAGYAGARDRMTVTIDTGAGSVSIR